MGPSTPPQEAEGGTGANRNGPANLPELTVT